MKTTRVQELEQAVRDALAVPDNRYRKGLGELSGVTYVEPREPWEVLSETREVLARALADEDTDTERGEQ